MGDSVTKVGEAKVSANYQIALVKEVRPWLGVQPGDFIEFHVENERVIMRKKPLHRR